MLSKFPEALRQPLSELSNCLSGKNFEDFSDALSVCTVRDVCDVMLRNADKKRDRYIACTLTSAVMYS